jgi:hypothetical protein
MASMQIAKKIDATCVMSHTVHAPDVAIDFALYVDARKNTFWLVRDTSEPSSRALRLTLKRSIDAIQFNCR